VDYRTIMLSRFNIQYLNRIGNSVAFIKEWTIRESAIKCYGDLTLNSIYGVETYRNILKCDGKPDLEYHVFRYENTYICVTRKLVEHKKTKK
jgi:CII-binding regulator of phage lambda lysogenization HflD